MAAPILPSTATTGFFQARPTVQNAYKEDIALQRAMALFLTPEHQAQARDDLHRWGDVVLSPQVKTWIADAEAHPPILDLRDTFGAPLNRLITSQGWQRLQDLGLAAGIVATGYESSFGVDARTVQFVKQMPWVPSSAMVTCPSAMQDGAAALLRRHLAGDGKLDERVRKIYESAYERLTSREVGFAWTSGQWMTERTGGSDVRGTETRARPVEEAQRGSQEDLVASDGCELGPWAIDGFKWFSSATDCDMAVLLAKTPGSDKLSCFLAPTRLRSRDAPVSGPSITGADPRSNTEFNGIYPQRLKSKLGGQALPTAELELKGMRGWMIGQEGQGVKEISPVLSLTRIHNASSAMGYLGRGLAVMRAYSKVRKVGGGALLAELPAHVKTVAYWHVEYRAHLLLSVFMAHCLGISEGSASAKLESRVVTSRAQAVALLRLCTPVSKSLTSFACVAGLRASMESMGGIGYLENNDVELNVARIFRDANVLPIWEGTTNIMAGDVIRVLKGREGPATLTELQKWVRNAASKSSADLGTVILQLERLTRTVDALGADELSYRSVGIMETLGWIVMAVLLSVDASQDDDLTAKEILRRWLAKEDEHIATAAAERLWQETAKADAVIAFGVDEAVDTKARL